MRILTIATLLGTFGVCLASRAATSPSAATSLGENPAPVQLVRPAIAPLSAMAQLGKAMFFDPSLSFSGRVSCASCHEPNHYYGPPDGQPVVYGGPKLASQGARAVPSLMYLLYQPNFAIGPDPSGEAETAPVLAQSAAAAVGTARTTKTAVSTAQSATNLVPQGGLFWDGRADTLQAQAKGPLLNPFEMDGGSVAIVAAKLRAASYADRFTQLFGPDIFTSAKMTVSEALFAIARYQIEDPSFHPYSSKYDAWLEGKARLSPAEMRGYKLFNDPAKGDCAACHLDQPSNDGQPPVFTDHQFEALGVPRNSKIAFNQRPDYFDLGICGPYRTDLAAQTQYCGMFLTPTLRNSATRRVFFHNGLDHDLRQVMDFYDFRDTQPAKVYPRDASGQVEKYNDLPKQYWANIDIADPPFDRELGQAPALSENDEADIIAFLKTLTDGYIIANRMAGK
jgi:cytochrome c peroxidase